VPTGRKLGTLIQRPFVFGWVFRSHRLSIEILGMGGAEERGSKGSLWLRPPETYKSQRHNPEVAAN